VAVMVIGKAKAARLQVVCDSTTTIEDAPIKGVQPSSGELRWYLDADACGEQTPKR
jgi:6-phosphogluconolactonase/glucosamine-6-phosphate isomerase/deaminase